MPETKPAMPETKPAIIPGLIATASKAKPWYHSRTIWFNLAHAALYGLDQVKQMPILHNYAQHIVVFMIFGNLFMRVITDSAIQRGTGSTTITAIDPKTIVAVVPDPPKEPVGGLAGEQGDNFL